MRRFRASLPNILLGVAFLGIVQAGFSRLGHIGVDPEVADHLRTGRMAFDDENYGLALSSFLTVLERQPESAIAAQGAACSSWRLGDGSRALGFEQLAVWGGLEFGTFGNCYGSIAPYVIFRPIEVGQVMLLYRRPDVSDVESTAAIAQAKSIAETDVSLAASLVACMNLRYGLDELAAQQVGYARLTSRAADPSSAVAAQMKECAP